MKRNSRRPAITPLFDPEDGFFYDVLEHPDSGFHRFRVRSLVGLAPLFAVEQLELAWIEPFKEVQGEPRLVPQEPPRDGLRAAMIHPITGPDGKMTYLLTIVDIGQLRRLLGHMYDDGEFLSRSCIRSLSKLHEHQPFVWDGRSVGYEPGESISKLKGGNSNWRGPIWFPTTFLIVESTALARHGVRAIVRGHACASPMRPCHSRCIMITRDVARRLIDIFLLDERGRRPVYGATPKFADDPRWRDHLLFFEYFHGDNGAGLGASHQTGWTALIANLIDEWR